ncbi:MAG TPA: SBBP repeat-containing protein [Gaiellales bacterium]|nr:SBBP repeat-containing protein [Gaiellales bacterium]
MTKLNPTGSALTYSTFVGGTQVDNGQQVSVDSGGNAYVLGFTSSTDFPTTPGAFDTTANGAFDATVTKLNPAGSALVYSTYLGGAGFDNGSDVTVDGGGNAYIAGGTGSTDFPTTPGAFDTTSDGSDGFVTKLNSSGSAAVYSTVFGGTGSDAATGIVLDTSGNAWLSGSTTSADFPVSADAADGSFNGGSDAIIAELNASGSALPYATFLGGSQSDGASDIGRDSAGNLYITGSTQSRDFPATTGAFDTVWNGDPTIFWGDAFVTKLSLTGGTTPPAPPPVPTAPTLLAPGNASSPAQPVGFDWSDVTGAATYNIQIDDSSAFTAPLVRDVSVTASNYLTGGLATTTQFWRVRGVNTAGTPGAWSAARSFTPQAAPPPTALTNLDVNPSTVAGGDASSGTVIVSVAAPDTTVVSLSSSNTAVASVPASVTVPTGGFTGTFTITTSAVAASTTVTITASYNGTSRTAPLTVTPAGAPPPAPALQGLLVSPDSVAGGSGSQGVVTLSGAAPAGGTTVSLSSANSGVASVPTSVTVAEGSSNAVFAISTSAVAATTTVTISASANGVTRTATLTVTTAPPPPQTATLTVTASGRGGERVTSSPAGISAATGTSGSASFAVGTSITLSVTNGRSAIWSGACSSGGSKTRTCTFTLSGTAAVTANVQ